MISPYVYENAIKTVRLLCGVTVTGRQYTFVEVTTISNCDNDITMKFHVPPASNPRSETVLAMHLGGNPVASAAASWTGPLNFDTSGDSVASMLRPASPEFCPEETNTLYGTFAAASILLRKNRSVTTACWSHDIYRKCLFVPLVNDCLQTCEYIVYAMQGQAIARMDGCERANMPLCRNFRFDICSAKDGVVFESAEEAIRLPMSPGIHFTDLYIALDYSDTEDLSVNANGAHLLKSVNGCVIDDRTDYRFVQIYDVVCIPVLLICGFLVADDKTYPGLHVPFTLREFDSRKGPIVIRHSAPDKNIIECVRADGQIMFRTNVMVRSCWNNAIWLSAI